MKSSYSPEKNQNPKPSYGKKWLSATSQEQKANLQLTSHPSAASGSSFTSKQ
jgi:hypothetical protein